MAGAKDMKTKNTDLLAAMQARTASGGLAKKLPDKPEEARTGPGQLAIFSGQLADAIARAEAAEVEVERLKEVHSSGEALAEARVKLAEAEAALVTALASQPRRKAQLDELHEIHGRRRRLTPDQYAELRSNLEHNPLAHPVTVRSRPEGGYEIVSGHNRASVYRELGRKEIDITVLELTDDETDRTAFYSNLLAPNLTDYEKYIGFKHRMARKGYTQVQVAAEAGVSQPYISSLMAFDELPKPALENIATSPSLLGATAAAKLANLAKSGQAAKVVDAVQKLVTGHFKSQDAAVQYVSEKENKQQNVRPSPLVIRQGKTKFCEMLRADKTVRLSFATADDAENAMAIIKTMLEAKVKESSLAKK